MGRTGAGRAFGSDSGIERKWRSVRYRIDDNNNSCVGGGDQHDHQSDGDHCARQRGSSHPLGTAIMIPS